MKYFPLAVLAVIVAGCAAQPPTQEAAARRHAANIAAAADAGYKVITEDDGRTMFCPSEAPIGSHLHACVTERQWEEDQLWVFNWKAFSAPESFNVATR